MPSFSVDPRLLEELLNYCLDFAKMMIEGHGQFHPFGAVITSATGQVTAVGMWTGEEHPAPSEVVAELKLSMASQFEKGEIIAAAITANVNIPAQFHPSFPDGIRVHLECRGYSRFIYLPYKIEAAGTQYGTFIPVDIAPVICSKGQQS